MDMQRVGSWAFIIGVCLALIIGIFNSFAQSTVVITVLLVAGLVVGLLNVSGGETRDFLFAVLALVLIAYAGGSALSAIAGIGDNLQAILNALVAFIVPAGIVVALKAIFASARD